MTLPHSPDYSGDSARLARAREVFEIEAQALHLVSMRIGESFLEILKILQECRGRILVTGIGKSGDIAQKIVGTLNSTGTRAYFLDPTRAVHGDLGMIDPQDMALVFSHSGEGDELARLLEPLSEMTQYLFGITSKANSLLHRRADQSIIYGSITESCPLSLAPSTSATVMMTIGHVIAFDLSEIRQFTREDFARYHPAGTLGKKLASVNTYMREGHELRIARMERTVREVLTTIHKLGRRTGAIMLVDALGVLVGIFTDSDLAKLFENRDDTALDRPISEVMSRNPLSISSSTRMENAIEIFQNRKISELPVIDPSGKPIGILDITDVIGLLPIENSTSTTSQSDSLLDRFRRWSA